MSPDLLPVPGVLNSPGQILGGKRAVVTDDGELKQDVFELSSIADIVDAEPSLGFRNRYFPDHADVRPPVAEFPGDDISGKILLRRVGDRFGPSLPFEKRHQVG